MKRCNLQILFVIFAVVVLAGVMQAQDAPVTITIWPNSYTPSRLLPASADVTAPQIQGIDPAIAAYQALHPNVTIEIVTQPGDGARTWLTSQLSGGIAPDIVWNQPDWAAEDYRKNWLVPIDSYLEKPNPYVAAGQPGSEKWHDLFEPAIDVWRAADDKLYLVLADQVQVGIYYNKAILDQAGVAEMPATWEELMQAAEKIKTAGFSPFAQSGNNLDQLTWVSGWLTNFYYASKLADYDTSGDGHLSKTEMAQAVKDGKYSFNDEANRARLEEMKRFSTYWQTGALGADGNAANRLFLTGRAGFLITGSWMYSTVVSDPDRTFDFGVMYFPVVDSSTSPLVADGIAPTNKAAGYGSFQYSVTQAAVARGTVDQAFDFLMFLTTPENLSPMITEAGFALPAVKGAESSPSLEPFSESIGYPDAPFQEDDSMFDFEFAQKFLAITSPYFAGDQDLEETVAQLDVELKAAADRVLGG